MSHLRSLFVLAVEGIADRPLLGPLDRPLDKLVIDLLLDEYPGSGAAALALVEEQSEVALFHRLLH